MGKALHKSTSSVDIQMVSHSDNAVCRSKQLRKAILRYLSFD